MLIQQRQQGMDATRRFYIQDEKENVQNRDLSKGFAAAQVHTMIRLFFCVNSHMLLQDGQLQGKNSSNIVSTENNNTLCAHLFLPRQETDLLAR